jgi:hypothetical protein
MLCSFSGLDPAGPLFESQAVEARLDATDAQFVDVIHSNGANLILGGLGSWQAMGHVDFYPNGGMEQKGCSNLLLGAVSDISMLWCKFSRQKNYGPYIDFENFDVQLPLRVTAAASATTDARTNSSRTACPLGVPSQRFPATRTSSSWRASASTAAPSASAATWDSTRTGHRPEALCSSSPETTNPSVVRTALDF